jgi:hypothetical protein
MAAGRQGHVGKCITVKMVSGLKGESNLEKSTELGLQSLEDRKGEQDLALVHKFLTERTKTDLFRRTDEIERARTRQAAGEQELTVK